MTIVDKIYALQHQPMSYNSGLTIDILEKQWGEKSIIKHLAIW